MSDLGIVNKPPYFDDFDPSKNYSKILFRPGRAVQSRELTQIQSILQKQLSSVSDKTIRSPIVFGGDFKIVKVKYLKFQYDENPNFLKNKLISFGEGDSVTQIKILEIIETSDSYSNNYTALFEYRSGNEFTTALNFNPLPELDQSLVGTVVDEENLEQTIFTFNFLSVPDYSTLSAVDRNADTGLSLYGDALLARLNSGVFYRKGYFVFTTEPLLLVLKISTQSSGSGIYTNYAPTLQNSRIGLLLSPEYVTTEEDPTLYDPSAGFYNFAAPGADRLKIVPSLIQIGDNTNLDVIELVDVINGNTRPSDPILKQSQSNSNIFISKNCDGDKILKPFIIDIIGSTLNINSGRAIVNCTDIEIVEPQTVNLTKGQDNKKLFNQAYNDQCLSDAVIVQSNFETPLFAGVSGNNYSSVNTNYFGSGKIRKLFSDEATRLEIVNCDGIKIGCLTLLDIEKNDDTSFRLYYNELQSYVSTIATENLFSDACTISLDGEKVFTIESPTPVTCMDSTPGGKKRLVYRMPRGSNIRSVFDSDYMITRDFVGDISSATIPGSNNGSPISAVVCEFNMDIPDGVFNDNNTTINTDMFIASVNGKVIPLKSGTSKTPHMRINESKTKVTLVLSTSEFSPTAEDNTTAITIPTAGKAYLITKVRFPEKSSATPSGAVSSTPIPHRKKKLREARGSYVQNLYLDPTISLGFSDVYTLKSIVNSNGTDITDRFIFDDGQRNDRYDHASVSLLPGITVDNSEQEYTILFRYFEHEPIAPGFYGPITVNSYGFDSNGLPISGFHGLDLSGNQMTLQYYEIPNFLDRISGEVISLADAIDYRMIRTEEGLIENGVSKSSILRARWFPSPDSSSAVESSYKLDLPRIDLLVLREDGTFVLLEGEPSKNPVPPEYPKDGCVIAEINVPGTIVSSEDFIIRKPLIKTMTLPELNDLQGRLSELEKAVSIQTLENKAKIQSAALRNEFLTGMIVDDFGGHYVGDVSNDEYNCSMDFSKGTLRLPFTTNFFDFIPSLGYPTSITAESGYFLTAEENVGVTLVQNLQATTVATINSFGSNEWHGYLSIDRPFHLWIDQSSKPVIRNNQKGQNDAWESGGQSVQPNGRLNGFGTQWGFWKNLWFGDRLLPPSSYEKDRAVAKGFSDEITNNAPSRFTRSINYDDLFAPNRKTIGNGGFGMTDRKSNRYVDSSLSFFTPENYIIIRGFGLKPNTVFSVFFDNVNTPVLPSRIMDLNGEVLQSLVSSDAGTVEFVLYIPNAAYITGNKVVKIIENTLSSNPSYASTIYQNNGADWKDLAEGDDNTVEYEFYPIGRTDVLLKNEKTLYNKNISNTGIYQKFFIDGTEHPKGIILDRIGVYFSNIDTNIPVSIEIRKIIDGVVDDHNIIRGSRTEILPTTIGYSEFTFNRPIYLSSGEYSILLKTNSNLYKVHISQKGLIRVDTDASEEDEDILATSVFGTNGLFAGSLFSQAEDFNSCLRFYIKRKSFKTSSITERYFIPRLPLFSPLNKEISYDMIYFANNNWRLTTGDVDYALANEDIVDISSNTDIEGSDIFDTSSTQLRVRVATSRTDVSSIVDIRKLGILLIKNHISKTTDIMQNGSETKSFAGSNGSLMKYISRRTDLKLPANVLRTTFDAVVPTDIDIKLYAKVLYEGDLDFDSQPYIEMQKILGSSAISKDKFTEQVFELDLSPNSKNFISFCVKVITTSNSTDVSTNKIEFYPEIRNLSVVSSMR